MGWEWEGRRGEHLVVKEKWLPPSQTAFGKVDERWVIRDNRGNIVYIFSELKGRVRGYTVALV